MKNAPLYLLFALITIPQFRSCEASTQEFDPIYDVADVMSDLLKTAPKRKLYLNHEKRYKFATDIFQSSVNHMVPELLLTVNVFRESSFRKDALSENTEYFGLGQMHGVASVECDIETRKGQLDCTAKWLRVCYEKCGTWRGAITAYKTRLQCTTDDKTTKRRVNSIIHLWWKYEQQREHIRQEIINDAEHIASVRD